MFVIGVLEKICVHVIVEFSRNVFYLRLPVIVPMGSDYKILGGFVYSEAQKRATSKYHAKAYDQVSIRVPKGTRDRWRALAEMEGKSLAAYIVSRVEGACAHAEEIIDGSAPPQASAQEPPKAPSEPSDA